jgi:hypothetical protein
MNGFRTLIPAAALVLMTGSLALADAPELFLSSGAANSGVVVGSSGEVTYSNSNLGGWNVSLVFAISNSPTLLPVGIDITSFSAACVGGGTCAALDVWASDVGYTQATTSFTNTYSLTADSTHASTTQQAWDDPSNNFFGSASGMPPVTDGAHNIGTVGPLSSGGTGGQVKGGGPESGTPAYSLTLEDVFAGCTGVNCVSYSSDGAVTSGVPEPGAVVLFGTVLALCATKLRRRRAS